MHASPATAVEFKLKIRASFDLAIIHLIHCCYGTLCSGHMGSCCQMLFPVCFPGLLCHAPHFEMIIQACQHLGIHHWVELVIIFSFMEIELPQINTHKCLMPENLPF